MGLEPVAGCVKLQSLVQGDSARQPWALVRLERPIFAVKKERLAQLFREPDVESKLAELNPFVDRERLIGI